MDYVSFAKLFPVPAGLSRNSLVASLVKYSAKKEHSSVSTTTALLQAAVIFQLTVRASLIDL